MINELTYFMSRDGAQTRIEVDNSTEYKDFIIKQQSIVGGTEHSEQVSLCKGLGDERELTIGNVKLRGMEISLLMSFINQNL